MCVTFWIYILVLSDLSFADRHLEKIINDETIGDAQTTVVSAINNVQEVKSSSTACLQTLELLDEDARRDVATESIMTRYVLYIV